ncbi:protein FAR1-RELATED SEQUENCE 5-like [Cicer arietinum]|uniref:Protein FAR1-RELATED SEQUENCE 5-like n=1 Tax=Cicer arietinum TaxID=3827 RepID=A0A1S3EB13_CICAR|nr:protein FAR1-RELATED SEQUENCE 5-like [Cicer arietinum]
MDCGAIEDEGIRVDNLDDDDNACCWEPATRMGFSCLEEVKSFYEEYASRKDFGWKIRSSRKWQDGEPCYLILSCSREGSKVSKISCTLKTLPTKVNNCLAKIVMKLDKDGLWYITKFELDHTHETSPTKARLFKANKKMNLHVKRTIQINDDAGVRINNTFQSLVKDAGGHENVPFCEREVRNYVNKERRAIGKEDLDDDFHVRNVFWADARSRAAYEYFGDVVTFDITYLTNKYDMPFAAFVCVNHHGQSTLLVCGLLSGEDTYSFV